MKKIVIAGGSGFLGSVLARHYSGKGLCVFVLTRGRLRVYPVWYYDLWAEDITREVHLRVMQHIKTLAENDV